MKEKYFKLIQLFVLVALCLQTTGYCVCLSISKNILKETYSNYEVLGLSEILKLVVSYLFLKLDSNLSNKVSLYNLFNLLFRGKKLVILVILYSIANTIPFYAIKLIGAPVFTVVMQLKIFATAGFSTCMLGREYSATKWRALVLLVVGCILVSSPIINQSTSTSTPQSQSQSSSSTTTSTTLVSSIDSIDSILPTFSPSISPVEQTSLVSSIFVFTSFFNSGTFGLFITLIQASISGFTSVYFERLLKDKDDETTIWERNFQLAFYSIIVLLTTVMYEQIGVEFTSNSTTPVQPPLFQNWTIMAFILALFQALGGLLVAGTLRYADSVLKCFATAVSIILTSIIGYFFLGNIVDLVVALGYCVTVISIFNYTLDTTIISLPSALSSSQQQQLQQQQQLGDLKNNEENDEENNNLKLSK